mgnify:CR=1 FL=1
MDKVKEVIFTNDVRVKDMVLMLFLGVYDGKTSVSLEENPPSFKTQEEIAEAIKTMNEISNDFVQIP